MNLPASAGDYSVFLRRIAPGIMGKLRAAFGRRFPVFRPVRGGFRAPVSAGGFPISVSAGAETGSIADRERFALHVRLEDAAAQLIPKMLAQRSP
jgi:hypothetical protein